MDTADALLRIATTFAHTTIHIDDVEIFFDKYVDTYFPNNRHSKEWALRNLKIDYDKQLKLINKEKGKC